MGFYLNSNIAYDRKTKEHTCKIEVLREALRQTILQL